MIRKIVFVVLGLSLCHVGFAHASSSLVKMGSNAIVEEGTTVDEAVVIGGNLSVHGTVTESAVVIGGDLDVGPTGRITGDSVVVFGKLIKAPGAEVKKDVVEIPLWKPSCAKTCVLPIIGIWTLGVIGLSMFIGFLIVLILSGAVFTDKIGKTLFYVETRFWKSLYYGVVAAILLGPIALLLLVSIIGIPLIPLLVIAVSAATLFGYAVVCQLIGVKFFRAIKKPGRPMYLEIIIGFIILGLVALIPFVGWIVKILAWLVGFGATIATRFGYKS